MTQATRLNKRWIFASASLLVLSWASSSFATTDSSGTGQLVLSLAVVGNSQTKQLAEDNLRDELNFGGAAFVEFLMGDHFGVETGAMLVQRQYDVASGPLRLVQETQRLHIPVLARYWVADYFSAAAGPYASVRVGGTRSAAQVGEAEAALETSASRDLELGFDISVLFNLGIANKTGLFAEGRYSLPFQTKGGEKASEVYALMGVKLHLH